MLGPQYILHERFAQAIVAAFGDEYAETDPLIRPAQNRQFGDFQSNVAMSLAKRVAAKPRDVAERLVKSLDVRGIAEVRAIAGPGFINLALDDGFLARFALEMLTDPRLAVPVEKHPNPIVLDYSAPNVAKEMHVGHLRSTVIGDALARVLGFLGHRVIRQNHIGDWGTQFGMLLELMLEEGISDAGREYHVGDLNQRYRQAQQRYQSDPDFAERARRRVVELQRADQQTYALWQLLIEESCRHFAEIYERLGVLLSLDDVRGESAYNDRLADVVTELDGRGLLAESDGARCVFPEGFSGRDGEPLPLIVQKSDGGYLYATTDLAAIRYRINELDANRLVYVTDARQKQHFAMVFAVAKQAGWVSEDVQLEHVPFGMVLGEDGRPLKTRSGENVKLIDLLNEAEQRATAIVTEKNPELVGEQRTRVGHVVGIGALKYADLSNDRTKDYVFSWDRMLAMDGNTAPYLQYAYARICSIFRKAETDLKTWVPPDRLVINESAERELVMRLGQFAPVVESVGRNLEPHHLCTYLFDLATAFSGFYEQCPVLKASQAQVRESRLALCALSAAVLRQGLNLLGIDVLERM